jgi:hypothetical protein
MSTNPCQVILTHYGRENHSESIFIFLNCNMHFSAFSIFVWSVLKVKFHAHAHAMYARFSKIPYEV